jgi:hypothetical protein
MQKDKPQDKQVLRAHLVVHPLTKHLLRTHFLPVAQTRLPLLGAGERSTWGMAPGTQTGSVHPPCKPPLNLLEFIVK